MFRAKLPLTPAKRAERSARQAWRGQSLAIFAISAVVLFGICGLAIDSGISYLNANKVERAAAAGALAGVTYMPDQYATALTAAAAAVQRNGGYIDNGPGNTKVYVYRVPIGCGAGVPCLPNRLGVGVQTDVSNTFTKILGFGPTHAVRQDAVAEYLSTLTLGQPGSHIGSTEPQINGSPQTGFYFLRTEGWGTPRSEGDAYTPNPNGSTDIHTINNSLEASVPGTWNALPSCGGYSFQIVVPSTEPANAVHVEVYNPAFAPDQPSQNTYRESDSTFDNTKPAQYDTMMYTLFRETDPFNRAADVPLGQLKLDPINATNASQANWTDEVTGATLTASSISTFYHAWVDPFASANGHSGAGVQLVPATKGQFSYGALAPGSTYRLRVDTLDGTSAGCSASGVAVNAGGGHKGYAVRVVDSPGVECAACNLGGINELAFYTPLVSSGVGTKTFDIPMVNVPAVYAGQTIDIYAYDPGDVGAGASSSNYIDVIDPCPSVVAGSCAAPVIASDASNIKVYNLGINKATVPSASNLVTATNPGYWPDTTKARVLTNNGGGHPFNGEWLLFKVPVPNTYAPTSVASQYWSLRYELTNATATDTLTISVGFDGPPVHLVPGP